MSQEVKIPVSANTGPAEKAADELAEAFDAVADSVASIATASQQANRGFGDLLRRARDTRQMLQRELKADVSGGDTVTFMRNFAGMQPRSNSLRGFRTELDWYSGHSRLFKDDARAAEHRRRVFAYGMQGTSFAAGGMPNFAPPGGGGGGGGGGGSPFAAGAARAANSGLAFGKSMLALAGISSIIGMAGRGRDLATEEGVGTDTLKRRMGDLGISFDQLRDQSRAAAVGLGITYVESQRLATAFAGEVGNLTGDFRGRLRGAMGFSRSYGLDPSQGVQFFGQMARFGVGRDESSERRLALMIGDAVAKSGYTGKVGDLIQAVADYTAASARVTLSAPNALGYTSALTSLMSRGLPGLDPQSAAALLGTADASMRRGGAMGDASLNFMYAAMRNASPGIKPVDALALMEGGLFGTTDQVFGKGSALNGMMGKGVALNGTTNFDKIMPMFRRFYGRGGYMLDAVKNTFGLSSHAQAAALVGLSDKGLLGASEGLLKSAGVDPMSLNATGFATVGQIANADHGGLRRIYGDVMGRSDLTSAQKEKFAKQVGAALRGGDDGAARTAMVQAVANLYQEKTQGSETRQAVVDLTDKLTEAGGALLQVLNPIRDAVVAIANRIAPGYMDMTGTVPTARETVSDSDLKAGLRGRYDPRVEQDSMKRFMAMGWSRIQAAAIAGNMMDESGGSVKASNNVKGGHRGRFQWDVTRWRALVAWANQKGLDPNDPATQDMYFDYELRHSEVAAGSLLKSASTVEEANAAVIDALRPGGWKGRGFHNKSGVEGFRARLAISQRLASDQVPDTSAASAGKAQVEGHVDVHVHTPHGKQETKRVPLKPVTAPRAAGSAPLVKGTISYPAGGSVDGL